MAEWINRNFAHGQSVWVQPGFPTYPLMFHVSKALYAWQLKYPPEEQFKSMPKIHFEMRVAPQYIIEFGPRLRKDLKVIEAWAKRGGPKYKIVHTVPLYWYDLTRPELFMHAFEEVTNFDRNFEGVVILKRIRDPAVGERPPSLGAG